MLLVPKPSSMDARIPASVQQRLAGSSQLGCSAFGMRVLGGQPAKNLAKILDNTQGLEYVALAQCSAG